MSNYLLAPDQSKTKLCPDCYGNSLTETEGWFDRTPCSTCQGEGEIVIDTEDLHSRFVESLAEEQRENEAEEQFNNENHE